MRLSIFNLHQAYIPTCSPYVQIRIALSRFYDSCSIIPLRLQSTVSHNAVTQVPHLDRIKSRVVAIAWSQRRNSELFSQMLYLINKCFWKHSMTSIGASKLCWKPWEGCDSYNQDAALLSRSTTSSNNSGTARWQVASLRFRDNNNGGWHDNKLFLFSTTES